MNHAHDNIPTPILIIIMIGYLIIAIQFGLDLRKQPRSEGRTGLITIISIFILCSICGYLPNLIPIPHEALLVAHCVLALSTWRFILTRQASIIAKSLKH